MQEDNSAQKFNTVRSFIQINIISDALKKNNNLLISPSLCALRECHHFETLD